MVAKIETIERRSCLKQHYNHRLTSLRQHELCNAVKLVTDILSHFATNILQALDLHFPGWQFTTEKLIKFKRITNRLDSFRQYLEAYLKHQ